MVYWHSMSLYVAQLMRPVDSVEWSGVVDVNHVQWQVDVGFLHEPQEMWTSGDLSQSQSKDVATREARQPEQQHLATDSVRRQRWWNSRK